MSVAAVFVASLLGSLHCVGMCGGFAAMAGGASPALAPDGTRSSIASHRYPSGALAYHLGRLVAYVALGALAGSIGAALDLTAHQVLGWHRVAAWLSAAVLFVMALAYLRPNLSSARLIKLGPSRENKVQRLIAALLVRAGVLPRFLLGLATAVLPCAWLWSFVVVAAASSSPLLGAASLLAFWAGTVPALLGVSVAAGWLTRKLGRFSRPLAATLLFALAVSTLLAKPDTPVDSPQHAGCH